MSVLKQAWTMLNILCFKIWQQGSCYLYACIQITKEASVVKASFFINFQRGSYFTLHTGTEIVYKKTESPGSEYCRKRSLFYFKNGFTATVKSTPVLLSFILPNPIPLKGSFTYGSARIENCLLMEY
jgi:hypothetical protein